jgi:hypothetical protein
MPKTSVSKNRNAKVQKPRPKFLSSPAWLTVIFFIVLALVFGGAKFYLHERDIQKNYAYNKVAYAYLEGRKKQAMDAITAAVGQPYELNSTQGCAKSMQLFRSLGIGCYTGYRFSYEVADKNAAAGLTMKVYDSLHSFSGQKGFVSLDPNHINDSFEYNYEEMYGKGCDFGYQRYTAKEHNDTLGDNYKKAVSSPFVAEYYFNCGGSVRKAVYAVEKNT